MQTNTTTSKGRGRPRGFDKKLALDGAVALFMSKGYSATSLDELSDAMGIKRPSMYNAFGNKEAIFTQCVEHYFETISTPLAQALKYESLQEAFIRFFNCLLDFYCEDNLGCMATSTMPAEAAENRTVNSFYNAIICKIDALLQDRLETAKVSDNSDLRAQLLQGLMQTLSLRTRAGAKRSELEKLYRFGLTKILD
ncbi:TetR/AcrR family transcriptional regulator [Glaciecola sp. KUL10]|uniref:TetR/AcrR family transcriptional regulator n=1 Tax=Glaciecola sp. (strain KUL10) TaxID=2161813 RepID=UPI000D7851B5|nr:TetR/AcrR family transcriptional regulator [Glaciecola sp. KUL10]GBL05984.1 transcriptional regulator [Glaciecola sp. KUL10]